MTGFIATYQELIGSVLGGFFALGAGALIFVEGRRRVDFERGRDKAAIREREKIAAGLVVNLENHIQYLNNKLSDFEELIDSYLDSYGDFPQIRLPVYPVEYRILNIYLNQMSGYSSLHSIVFELFEAIKDLERYDTRFNEFSVFHSRIAMKARAGQSLFPEIQTSIDDGYQEIRDNLGNAGTRAADTLDSLREAIRTWRAISAI